MSDPVANMTGGFGGIVLDVWNYTFPSDAEGWAGVANNNSDIYPLAFPDGGKIKFTASVPGANVEVFFKFEKNPFPDTEPSYTTSSVTVSGATEQEYEIVIPPQGSNTYSSFLMYLVDRDTILTLKEQNVTIIQGEEEETPVFDFIPKPKLGAKSSVGKPVRLNRLIKTRC